MNRVRMLVSRLAGLFGARGLDAELDEEMRGHLERLAEEHRRRGLSHDEARLAARRDFGSIAHTTERYREQRGMPSTSPSSASRQRGSPARRR